MSLDSLNAYALLLELRSSFREARVQKFSQLDELDFLLHLRSPGRTDKLLFSLHPERSRFHLLPPEMPHPPAIVPSAFVMLCRKHFGGCRLLDIQQLNLERSLQLTFSSGYRLIFDWSGRPSALLLLTPTDPEQDGSKTVPPSVVAGAYPAKGRFALRRPLPETPAEESSDTLTHLDGELAWQKLGQLQKQTPSAAEIGACYSGLPPLWAKRLVASSIAQDGHLQEQAFIAAWNEILAPLVTGDAAVLNPGLEKDGELSYRSTVSRKTSSMSLAASLRWSESTATPGVPDHRSDLLRTLRKGRDKSMRKLEKRKKDKSGAESAPRDQLYGDLLLTYSSTITGRSSEFRTQDWEGRPVTIPLEPYLSATENADRYYTRAKKKKRALAILDEQIALAAEEIAFWEELIFAAESAENRTDLEEVRKTIPGPRQGKAKRAPQIPSSGPRRFEHDGFQILVGRNPTQNEKLSLRDAAKDDLWLHVRLGAGSHVVLRTAGRQPSENTVLTAAWLAATYSRSQNDPRCAVIATAARHLKKPKGGPVGKVTYRSEREIVVDPTSAPPEGLHRLDKKEVAP